MKQAILLIVHDKLELSKRLISYFQGKCDVFVHIDRKLNIDDETLRSIQALPGVKGVYQKYKVNWGGFSILKVELFLLKKAMAHSSFGYVHLLSGTDYPIRPLDRFLNKFDADDNDYIESTHLPDPNWHSNTMHRLQYLFLMDFNPVKKDSDIIAKWKFGEKLAHYGLKCKIPDTFPHIYGGSQWFSLTRKCVTALIDYTDKHPHFFNRMRFVFAPDEIYIPTVVMNIHYAGKKVVNDNLRFVNWKKFNAPHPATFDENDLCKMACGEKFFVRKIGENSLKAVELINTFLLSEELSVVENTGILRKRSLLNYNFDEQLATCISYLCKAENIRKVYDLGCGPGFYVHHLRKSKILAYGYDGNTHVQEQSAAIMNGTRYPCEVLLLHKPIEACEKADLVIFLSVGEYVQKEYEDIVIDNICRLSEKFLLISWAEDNNKNEVVNPKCHGDLVDLLNSRGFMLHSLGTQLLRDSAEMMCYKKNICLFYRTQ